MKHLRCVISIFVLAISFFHGAVAARQEDQNLDVKEQGIVLQEEQQILIIKRFLKVLGVDAQDFTSPKDVAVLAIWIDTLSQAGERMDTYLTFLKGQVMVPDDEGILEEKIIAIEDELGLPFYILLYRGDVATGREGIGFIGKENVSAKGMKAINKFMIGLSIVGGLAAASITAYFVRKAYYSDSSDSKQDGDTQVSKQDGTKQGSSEKEGPEVKVEESPNKNVCTLKVAGNEMEVDPTKEEDVFSFLEKYVIEDKTIIKNKSQKSEPEKDKSKKDKSKKKTYKLKEELAKDPDQIKKSMEIVVKHLNESCLKNKEKIKADHVEPLCGYVKCIPPALKELEPDLKNELEKSHNVLACALFCALDEEHRKDKNLSKAISSVMKKKGADGKKFSEWLQEQDEDAVITLEKIGEFFEETETVKPKKDDKNGKKSKEDEIKGEKDGKKVKKDTKKNKKKKDKTGEDNKDGNEKLKSKKNKDKKKEALKKKVVKKKVAKKKVVKKRDTKNEDEKNKNKIGEDKKKKDKKVKKENKEKKKKKNKNIVEMEWMIDGKIGRFNIKSKKKVTEALKMHFNDDKSSDDKDCYYGLKDEFLNNDNQVQLSAEAMTRVIMLFYMSKEHELSDNNEIEKWFCHFAYGITKKLVDDDKWKKGNEASIAVGGLLKMFYKALSEDGKTEFKNGLATSLDKNSNEFEGQGFDKFVYLGKKSDENK
jgi:hypothetical protein